jgi:hypothetical protein
MVVALAFATGGCSLDRPAVIDTVTPSETGVSVQLTALPDILNADGVSQAVVQLVLRDAQGNPIKNRSVLFEHNGDGTLYPSSGSTYVGPIQNGIVMATDTNGVAYVVYLAGTALGKVTISTRPYGIDAAEFFFYRQVVILQQ